MNFEYWIELKRADFLSALKTLKPTLRVKSAPPRELQIGFEDSQVIFAIQGNSATKPATGNWPGLAEIKLSYFLSFLVFLDLYFFALILLFNFVLAKRPPAGAPFPF